MDQPGQVIADVVDQDHQAEQRVLVGMIRNGELVQCLGLQLADTLTNDEQLLERQRSIALPRPHTFFDACDLGNVFFEARLRVTLRCILSHCQSTKSPDAAAAKMAKPLWAESMTAPE